MHEWSLDVKKLPSLCIAADSYLDTGDYANDQIWELSSNRGEPLSLTLQTTYGLRARSMRIFPIFILNNETAIDPAQFFKEPILQQFFPNYFRLSYSPFSGIDVQGEYWVPSSQVLTCQTSITNHTQTQLPFRVEWAVLLSPLENGLGMTPAKHDRTPIMIGSTSNLSPVFIVSGNTNDRNGSFPSIGINLSLTPEKTQKHSWALASLSEQEASYTLALNTLSRPWETEIARLEMLNANRQIEIETGNPDWDAAFALSQNMAFSLIMRKGNAAPGTTFVLSRRPDQGYSPKGDGSDHDSLWTHQTALETFYLANLILPGAADYVQNLVRLLLLPLQNPSPSSPDPNLRLWLAPILSTLSLKVFETTQDQAFLEEIFPALVKSIELWFDQAKDRDQDGFPEWDHLLQTGYEDNPLFNRWRISDLAYEINTFESPALGALLYQEMLSLSSIARQINQVSTVLALLPRINALRKSIESSWDSHSLSYHYRDRDTHTSLHGKRIAFSSGPEPLLLQKKFPKPRRLQIGITSDAEFHKVASIKVFGVTPSGKNQEEMILSPFQWVLNRVNLTTQQVFNSVDRIETSGLSSRDRISVDLVDFSREDIALLLPLWAHIPSSRRVAYLVKKTIFNPQKFNHTYGLSAGMDHPEKIEKSADSKIHLLWNQMVIEGLLSYDYINEAVTLFTQLMGGLIRAWKEGGSFYHFYDAQTGEGSGERNYLDGLPPISLFLEILGVQRISSQEIILSGINPFSWPVTVKYRGLKVIRQEDTTTITFPDGQTTVVSGKEKRHISLT